MDSKRVPLYVLAAALSASAMESEVLNSERIAQRFGNYGIDVLDAKPGLRRSNLYSITDNERICRTYAVVKFSDQTPWENNEEHVKVLAGGSIGAVFKQSGWEIVKETLFVGSFSADSSAAELLQLMQLDGSKKLAMHAYTLKVHKDDITVDYATIIEAHHPDYLTEADLLRLFPVSAEAMIDADAVDKLVALLTESEQNLTQ